MSAPRPLRNGLALTALVGLGVGTGVVTFLGSTRVGSGEAGPGDPGWILGLTPVFWLFTGLLALAAWLLIVPVGLFVWRRLDVDRLMPRALLGAALAGFAVGPAGPFGVLLAVPAAWVVLVMLARREEGGLPVGGPSGAGTAQRFERDR